MTNSGKLYKCNRCLKLFNHKNDFRKHISRKNKCLIITKKSPLSESDHFKCHRCDKLYSSKSNLTRHLKGFCKVDQVVQSVSETDKDDMIDIPDDGKSMICPVSDGTSENPPLSMKNGKLINTENESNNQPINSKNICCYCKKSFTRRDNMVRHQTKGCNAKLIVNQQKELKLIITEMEKLRNELAKLKQNNDKKTYNSNNSNNSNDIRVPSFA